ncbi:hypothetical protein EX30DRAFT_395832 [Ascodesmis nigricans]|uniref:Uncharacterized protein n=1 Tax=Ascodesmis nigricans TaxID=341454 RepID=A0A4V3SIP8_9PEZI|nr:hypothetical protein EX30DRAFT_395832 [Ascodesmis nigricans]
MASTVVNFITTTLLTIITAAFLVFVYRTAVRPILVRHNVFPLRHLPATISQHFDGRRNGGIRLNDDPDLESAEQSFAPFEDEEEEGETGDQRPTPYRDEPVGEEGRDKSGGTVQAGQMNEESGGEGGLQMIGGALMGTSTRGN